MESQGSSPSRAEGSVPFVPGQVLAGKFRVERVLGVGGMGAVAAVTHLQLDELVALKVLLPELAANPEYAARFAREARAAVKIKSEHVARVLDVGALEDGAPYMVMEYLAGLDLGALVERQGPLEPGVAATYVLEACDAIAAAHALDIIHRDLKPSNLFLADRGDGTRAVKVLDFGISKVGEQMTPSAQRLTRTAAVMGSPLYMAPEQMQSARAADARTDVWALGCVLFELVVGAPPFVAGSMPELCALILTGPTPLPSRFRPGLPPELDAVVQRCLEKSPDARFGSIAELAAALLPLAPDAQALVARIQRRSTSIPPAGERPSRTEVISAPPAGKGTDAAWGQGTRPAAGRQGAPWLGVALLGGAAALLLALVAGAVVVRSLLLTAPAASVAAEPSSAPASAPALDPTAGGAALAGADTAPVASAPAPAPSDSAAPAAPVRRPPVPVAPAPSAARAAPAAPPRPPAGAATATSTRSPLDLGIK